MLSSRMLQGKAEKPLSPTYRYLFLNVRINKELEMMGVIFRVRIIQYPELQGTQKDHLSIAPDPGPDSPKKLYKLGQP